MTNGEKIQKDFKGCEVCEPIVEDDIIHVIFADKKNSAIGFDWSWWNAEYKEPSNSTSSDTKSETLVRLDVYNQVAKERDMAIQQLHDLGYELGITIPDIKYHSHHCVDRRLVEALVHRYLKEATDDHVAFYEELLDLPLVTPIRPKGHWFVDERPESDREVVCSNCDQPIFKYHKLDFDYRPKYCPNCGAEMREVEE